MDFLPNLIDGEYEMKTLCMFRKSGRPEFTILGADQKERSLWGQKQHIIWYELK